MDSKDPSLVLTARSIQSVSSWVWMIHQGETYIAGDAVQVKQRYQVVSPRKRLRSKVRREQENYKMIMSQTPIQERKEIYQLCKYLRVIQKEIRNYFLRITNFTSLISMQSFLHTVITYRPLKFSLPLYHIHESSQDDIPLFKHLIK